MNNKIPLRVLAERIAAQTGCDIDAAQSFVKTLFGIVSDKIFSGSSISVGGLGTFVGSPNPDEPVRLIVDPGLADELNAPFSMFQSVLVNNDITLDDLDSVDNDQNEEIPADNIQPENVDIAIEEMPEKDCVEAEVHSENEDIEVEDSISPVASDSQNEIVDKMADDECFNEVVEEVGNPDESSETDDIHSSEKSVPETVLPDEPQITVDSSTIPEDEEEYAEYYEEPKSRFWPGFFIGLISGLIIGALCFVGYILYFVETGTKLF